MSASAPGFNGNDDDVDGALRTALDQFHADLREQARIDASHFATYATIYRAAEALTSRDCGPVVAATKRDETFAWHLRSVAGEFACDSQLTDGALMNRARNANSLFTKFPYWHEALAGGEVQVGHVHAMLRQHGPLTPDKYEHYGKKVLGYARRHTVAQTESFAKRLVAKLMRDAFEAAFKEAHSQRRVVIHHDEHGMANLHAYIPSFVAQGIDARLAADAKAMREVARAEIAERRGDADFAPDNRTRDQHRADIFIDTLVTATAQAILDSPAAGAARIKATVSIVTPLLALRDPALSSAFTRAGGSDSCDGIAMLNGVQPVSAAEVREWAVDAELERILTHPVTGHVITADRYEPTASLRRYLRARDVTCRFPGCRRPVHQSELDHTQAWAEGGKTHPENLAFLCLAHHTQKHQQPWSVRHLGGGVLEWTPPLGQVIITTPEPPGPIFAAVNDPPPF